MTRTHARGRNVEGCVAGAALLALALAGCSGSGKGLDDNGRPIGEGGSGELIPEFQSIQDHVFTPICTQCHAGAAAPEGMSLEQGRAYASLVGVASHEVPGLLRVNPGDPDNSYLMHKILGTQESGDRMPRGLPPLPAATIEVIRQWIADGAPPPTGKPPEVESSPYSVTALTANGGSAAHVIDTGLVNPWGVAFAPGGGAALIARQGSATARPVDGTGTAAADVIAVPGAPTAVIANTTSDFTMTLGDSHGPAKFILALDDGRLAAYAPEIVARDAPVVFDGSASGAAYTGLAIIERDGASLLLAADFHNGRIDVFDAAFTKLASTGFVDPTLPSGYAPFGLQVVGGMVAVAYAAQPTAGGRFRAGAGLGLIDLFDVDGNIAKHLIAAGGASLNAPWAMTIAPSGSGNFAGSLLIGNAGDGRIHAFDTADGHLVGTMDDTAGQPLAIPGLWGLAYGNGAPSQPATTLFFTAGPNGEADGVFGRIDPGTTPPDSFTPVVTLSVPAGDLSATVTLSATASDDVAVVDVKFLADGVELGTDTSPPYSFDWDTTTATNGVHRLDALARDAAGNTGHAVEIETTVANETEDTTPPSVTLHAPAGDLSGTVTLTADATDDVGVVQVRFFADGDAIGTDNTAPFSIDWLTDIANGAHTLTARASDAAGNTADSGPVTVTVANATLTQVYEQVFGPICSACHDGSDPTGLPGSMNLSLKRSAFNQIVGVTSEEDPSHKRIQPGDADASYMIRKVQGGPDIQGERMPYGCPLDQPCLDQATIDLMRQWVNAGARNN